VPFSDLLDMVEITLGDDIAPDAGDTWPELVILDQGSVADDPSRTEPTLARAQLLVEFDEPMRLDATRVGLTWELPVPSSPTPRWRSSLSALVVHVLPLLMILAWPATATEAPVIPVQLVLEQPPPDPPQAAPQPAQPKPPPPPPSRPKPGHLASEDMGAVKPKTVGKAKASPSPAAGQKQPQPSQPSPTQVATAVATPPAKVAPANERSAAVQPPKPSGAVQPHREETPHEAPRPARYEGPDASRDEYLAYLVTLTRQHIDLLPMSVVGTRRGETQVSVAVQDDGTILRISVFRGSGYPDIDERIERMVAAVGRFPPVPQWFQGHTLEVTLTLQFPEALEGR